MDMEKIINDLKSQNLDDNQIMTALQNMVEQKRLSPQDFEKAKSLLSSNGQIMKSEEEQERKIASRLYGIKF